jgi:putative ABC transport system permease protein
MIWSIAWRNIWRNKLRSLVVILAVTLGLFGTLFLIAMSNGMLEQKIATSIENEISHIQLHDPRFVQDNSLQFAMTDSKGIVDRIGSLQGVKAVSDRIRLNGMASTAATGTGAVINGINPEQEKKVTKISELMVEGDYFITRAKTPSIIIGKKLGSKLNAKLGSKIVLTVQGTSGDINYGLFRVTGIYKTSNTMFDEANVFVDRADIASLTGFDPSSSTEIAVLLDNSDLTGSVTSEITRLYQDLSVQAWQDLQPFLKVMQSMMDQFGIMLLVIILIAMAFGIINSMLMAILERTHELGMLMAVGMNRRRVFYMIMLETLLLTLIGAAVGAAISVLTISLTGRNGINFSAWSDGLESWGYSALIYPALYFRFYVSMTVLVILTGVISSIFPARKALKLNPAEAIRTEA